MVRPSSTQPGSTNGQPHWLHAQPRKLGWLISINSRLPDIRHLLVPLSRLSRTDFVTLGLGASSVSWAVNNATDSGFLGTRGYWATAPEIDIQNRSLCYRPGHILRVFPAYVASTFHTMRLIPLQPSRGKSFSLSASRAAPPATHSPCEPSPNSLQFVKPPGT